LKGNIFSKDRSALKSALKINKFSDFVPGLKKRGFPVLCYIVLTIDLKLLNEQLLNNPILNKLLLNEAIIR
jgi:hypothetical protein